jgi:hypothetical protein
LGKGIVGAHAVKADAIHCLLYLGGAVAEETRSLHFAISQRSDLVKRSLIVLG